VIPHNHKVVGYSNIANYTFIYHTKQEPNIFLPKSDSYRDLSDDELRQKINELMDRGAAYRSNPNMHAQIVALRTQLTRELHRRQETSDREGSSPDNPDHE